MNFFSRVSIHDPTSFERITTRLTFAGALAGLLHTLLTRDAVVTWPLALAALAACALLGANAFQASERTLNFSLRLGGAALAFLVGSAASSVGFAAVLFGSLAVASYAGSREELPSRHLLGALGGAFAVGWALWLVPELHRVFSAVPLPLRSVLGGAVGGTLLGLGLLPARVRLHADGLSKRLEASGGLTGAQLGRTWARCQRALTAVPGATRKELLSLLRPTVDQSEQLLGRLSKLDCKLAVASSFDSQKALDQLRADASASRDAIARDRLEHAASSISDTLEALSSLQRQRERCDAELRLGLATLERTALALETAQGEPAELQTAVLRATRATG